MDENIEFITVAIPSSIYDQHVINLVEALLALDDKLFQEESQGVIPAQSETYSPKEAA
jgi:hypothetical protein